MSYLPGLPLQGPPFFLPFFKSSAAFYILLGSAHIPRSGEGHMMTWAASMVVEFLADMCIYVAFVGGDWWVSTGHL